MRTFIVILTVDGGGDGRHIAETIQGTVYKADKFKGKERYQYEHVIREDLQETWGLVTGTISVYPIDEYVNEYNDVDDDYKNPDFVVNSNWASYVTAED